MVGVIGDTIWRMTAMTLRLPDHEYEALRRKAAAENRSMQEVARAAVAAYVDDWPSVLHDAITAVVAENAEVLRRLGE